MTHTKHVFRQDAPCLRYAALGDTAVRVIALHHVVTAHDLDAIVVPQPKPELLPLWEAAFGPGRIIRDPHDIPARFSDARISQPTSPDWMYGSAGWSVFESVMWENGFFRTSRLRITPPLVFPCNYKARAAMIYPAEGTDGNRIYDSEWWTSTCELLRRLEFRINLLGRTDHGPLRPFFARESFDAVFPPTIDGLRECAASSSVAIGGNTGPSWALLMSDVPQIVLESKRSPHGYWNFDRCQPVLTKRLCIVPTVESFLQSPAIRL